MRALTSSFEGRKERKRQFRQLWIARINAAARMNGISYSKMMYGLKLAEVDINRKMLAITVKIRYICNRKLLVNATNFRIR